MRLRLLVISAIVALFTVPAGAAIPFVSSCDAAWAGAGRCVIVQEPGPSGVHVHIEGSAYGALSSTLRLRLIDADSGVVVTSCQVAASTLLPEARCTAEANFVTSSYPFVGVCEVLGTYAGLVSCSARPV